MYDACSRNVSYPFFGLVAFVPVPGMTIISSASVEASALAGSFVVSPSSSSASPCGDGVSVEPSALASMGLEDGVGRVLGELNFEGGGVSTIMGDDFCCCCKTKASNEEIFASRASITAAFGSNFVSAVLASDLGVFVPVLGAGIIGTPPATSKVVFGSFFSGDFFVGDGGGLERF